MMFSLYFYLNINIYITTTPIPRWKTKTKRKDKVLKRAIFIICRTHTQNITPAVRACLWYFFSTSKWCGNPLNFRSESVQGTPKEHQGQHQQPQVKHENKMNRSFSMSGSARSLNGSHRSFSRLMSGRGKAISCGYRASVVFLIMFLIAFFIASLRVGIPIDYNMLVLDELETRNRNQDVVNPHRMHQGNYTRIQCAEPCGFKQASILGRKYAPLFYILGTQKGGTSSLNFYLGLHPSVYYDSREGHTLQKSKVALKGSPEEHACPSKGQMHPVCLKKNWVNRCAVLEHYRDYRWFPSVTRMTNWAKSWNAGYSKRRPQFIDDTPTYLYLSHIVPQRLLCIDPNAKMVVLLRNPVERAFSEYKMRNFRRKEKGLTPLHSFGKVARSGMRTMASAGLTNVTITPAEEYKAWSKFHERHPIVNEYILPDAHLENSAPDIVARGMYHIQLRQYLAVLKDHFGEDKMMDHILILESEAFLRNKQGVYDKVLKFVGLDTQDLGSGIPERNHRDSTHMMTSQTRSELEEFYRPHNQKLHELLSPLGVEISWAKEAYVQT